MARIAELSKDVAKDYREEKKTKLQRTFVSAADAAETKISKFGISIQYLTYFFIYFFLF